MTTVETNLNQVRRQIAAACAAAGRSVQEVTLLAVSKTQPAAAVRAAHAAGQSAFGENYVQEALAKMDELADLPLQWHCIGPLQANKTRAVAERFDWAHAIDRLRIAERLSAQRPEHLPPLNVCIQVNVDGGPSKSGLPPHEALPLARAIVALPRLRLRGLMAIPEPQPDDAAARAVFLRPGARRPGRRSRARAGRKRRFRHPLHGHERRPRPRHRRRQHAGARGHGPVRRAPAPAEISAAGKVIHKFLAF